jgi:hypothetical protein
VLGYILGDFFANSSGHPGWNRVCRRVGAFRKNNFPEPKNGLQIQVFQNDGKFDELKKTFPTASQGCQIFLGTKFQNGKNIPNYYKIYQMSKKYVIKYTKRP